MSLRLQVAARMTNIKTRCSISEGVIRRRRCRWDRAGRPVRICEASTDRICPRLHRIRHCLWRILGDELAAHWFADNVSTSGGREQSAAKWILDLWLLCVALEHPIMVRGGGIILAAPQLARFYWHPLAGALTAPRARPPKKCHPRGGIGLAVFTLACLRTACTPGGFLRHSTLASSGDILCGEWIRRLLWRFFQLPAGTASANSTRDPENAKGFRIPKALIKRLTDKVTSAK